jgi:hypothetical protein
MKIKGNFLTPVTIDDGDCLDVCPHCNGNNLHQSHVSIFNPDGYALEWDEKKQEYATKPRTRVTHVMEDNTITTARVDPEATNNPSAERNGMFIEFWCETCEEKPTLAIFQHKGMTYLGWK